MIRNKTKTTMNCYNILEKTNYPKLYSYLDDKNLTIRSSFKGTDLDCAFHIVSKEHNELDRLKNGDTYIVFMHEAYDGSLFSWELTNRPCMTEDVFIENINNILKSDVKHIGSGNFKD